MELEKLKPCPFCGGGKLNLFYDEQQRYHAECSECKKNIAFEANSRAKAIEVWNTRTPPETVIHQNGSGCVILENTGTLNIEL